MRDGNVLLVANPASQHGNGAKLADIAHGLLVEWLGEDRVSYRLTESQGHATQIAAEEGTRFGTIIALGGDGIIHEAANGLMTIPRAQRPALGVIPLGSGNDFAQTLGMSQSVPDAVVQFLNASERAFDVGCCNDVHFVETLSFGLDAAIALDTVERRARTGQQGTMLYLSSGIHILRHHLDTYGFTAVMDGEREVRGNAIMFAVQNGPTYGGGFRICPDADPADGTLDICYAEGPMSIPVATFKFLSAKNAHHTRFKGIYFERATTLDLTFDHRPPCQVDGEALIADSYHITVNHAALDVLVP